MLVQFQFVVHAGRSHVPLLIRTIGKHQFGLIVQDQLSHQGDFAAMYSLDVGTVGFVRVLGELSAQSQVALLALHLLWLVLKLGVDVRQLAVTGGFTDYVVDVTEQAAGMLEIELGVGEYVVFREGCEQVRQFAAVTKTDRKLGKSLAIDTLRFIVQFISCFKSVYSFVNLDLMQVYESEYPVQISLVQLAPLRLQRVIQNQMQRIIVFMQQIQVNRVVHYEFLCFLQLLHPHPLLLLLERLHSLLPSVQCLPPQQNLVLQVRRHLQRLLLEVRRPLEIHYRIPYYMRQFLIFLPFLRLADAVDHEPLLVLLQEGVVVVGAAIEVVGHYFLALVLALTDLIQHHSRQFALSYWNHPLLHLRR